MAAIQVSHIAKTYRQGLRGKGGVRALADLSLTVNQGEIFGLLGPNGAGKTTLIKILLSLVKPTAGDASLLDIPLPNVGIRTRVGYLPENHRYPGYMTGEHVLSFFGRLGGVSSQSAKPRADELLRLVGLEQWKKMKVKRYSKGMLQRIGLAQALMSDPDLLFLDEPTDGVDPLGRKEIRDILKDLRARGKTIFLNSHLLSEVELVCDRVAMLNKGTLLKVGTIAEFTTPGTRYTIGIDGTLPDAVRAEGSALVLNLEEKNGVLGVHASTIQDLNKVIDLLRRNSVAITSVNQDRNTLEDSFLALLKQEAAQ
jgi:ABC-2 type transport system ATP-binding protein